MCSSHPFTSVVQELKQFALDGVVLVTTPQNIALGDVRREIAFCKKGEHVSFTFSFSFLHLMSFYSQPEYFWTF